MGWRLDHGGSLVPCQPVCPVGVPDCIPKLEPGGEPDLKPPCWALPLAIAAGTWREAGSERTRGPARAGRS